MTTTTTTIANVDVAHAEMVVQLNKDFDTPEKRASVEKMLTDAMAKPEFKDASHQEILKLKETVDSIMSGFREVRGTLLVFDSKNFKDDKGQDIKLSADWEGYQDRFIALINKSRTVATQAATVMEEYCKIILEDPSEYTFKEVIEELKNQQEIARKRSEEAGLVEQGFRKLAIDVGAYKKVIEAKVAAAEAATAANVERLKKELKSAKDTLAETQKKIKSLTAATATSFAVGIGAGILAVVTLNPIAIGVAVGGIIGGVTSGIKLKQAKEDEKKQQAEVDKKEQELKTEEEKLEWVRNYMKNLYKTYDTIDTVATKIDTIANIWNTIQQDFVRLQTQLESATGDPNAKLGLMWKGKLRLARATFEVLYTVLRHYSYNTKEFKA